MTAGDAEARTQLLEVPGARLHYEVRGRGPTLLLICGGLYDAEGYAGLARQLADRYTVLTYDRRGNSRSPLAGPPAPQSIEVHADDAHRLLTEIGVTGDAPAYVFGNSSGGIIGLELAARHPEQVRALVAHEPPVFELLPERGHWRTVIQGVTDAFRTDGTGAAMQVLSAAFAADQVARDDAERQPGGAGTQRQRMPGGAEVPPGEPDPETARAMVRVQQNMEFFIGYEVPPFNAYVPDIATLRTVSTRVLVAVGEDSVGEPPYRTAIAIADRLGAPPVVFPGDHGGFGARPEAFGATLHEVLSGS